MYNFSIEENEIKINMKFLGGAASSPAIDKELFDNLVRLFNDAPKDVNIVDLIPILTEIKLKLEDPDKSKYQVVMKEMEKRYATEFAAAAAAPAAAPAVAAAAAAARERAADLNGGVGGFLIGGGNSILSKVLVFMGISSRTLLDIQNNEIRRAAEWMLEHTRKSIQNDGEWDVSELTGSEYKKTTRRNNNNMLEILDPGNNKDYISINEYYKRSVSDARGNVTDPDALGCFESKVSPVLDKENENCLDALGDTGLWKQSTDQVQKMSPVMVFNIIKSLGFEGEVKDNKIRCQTYTSWENNLSDDKKTKLQKVLKNKDFINKLIGYLNANSSILNESQTRNTSTDPDYDDKGVPRARFNNVPLYNFDNLRHEVDQGMNHIKVRLGGIMGSVGYAPLTFKLFGGGQISLPLIPNSVRPVENIPTYSKQLRALYNGYIKRLEKMNKTLSQLNKDQIETVFKSLEEKEEQAKKLIGMFDSYALEQQLNPNNRSQTISKEDLTNAYENVQKVLAKLNKRSVSMIDIIKVMDKATFDSEVSSPGIALSIGAT